MDTPIVPRTRYTQDVYEPAEDSFLMLDALEKDLETKFSGSSPDLLCLEVGCGSGIVSSALANLTLVPFVVAADINPFACLQTLETAKENKVEDKVEAILLDGTLDNFRLPLFDVIVCNPPYVPVLPEERFDLSQTTTCSGNLLEKSWDGGPTGNSFIIPFLENVSKFLQPEGILYLLLSSWNEPEKLMNNVAKPVGLEAALVLSRRAGRESLSVWRLEREKKERKCL